MINAPTAKALLKHDPSIIPVIFECDGYFEIAIGLQPIAPQRMTSPPQARQFKTLAAAYSYLRNFLEHKSDILIKRHEMMQHWSDYLDGLQVDNVVAVQVNG